MPIQGIERPKNEVEPALVLDLWDLPEGIQAYDNVFDGKESLAIR